MQKEPSSKEGAERGGERERKREISERDGQRDRELVEQGKMLPASQSERASEGGLTEATTRKGKKYIRI